ncbi:STAS domain-containing protein [Flavobacterium sp. SUN052]|uniref:STAS domain-containing protein n=1 Tax=Flavobacterium sp. SUN052 TaxID=3002441 RepID=UPI00237D3718|nr:STAS domain-containing protein [Flavobacterium sp. SUN052]MEC4003990.1 STAS domain-containing protein [Flavobacterium sp. SUN052]
MALQITNNSGILEINGNLNSQNTNSFNNYFNALLESTNFITISLNNVVEMDINGLNTIVGLYKKALTKNSIFYIIGQENQRVVDLFNAEKLNYLLRKDVA